MHIYGLSKEYPCKSAKPLQLLIIPPNTSSIKVIVLGSRFRAPAKWHSSSIVTMLLYALALAAVTWLRLLMCKNFLYPLTPFTNIFKGVFIPDTPTQTLQGGC